MRTRTMTALAAAILALTGLARGGDWPQWNGPKRDGHADEKGLLKTWPKDGPKLLWTYDKAGTGFTAPAVVGGKVYTMGCRKDDEFVICLDDKGKELWATKIGPAWDFNGNQWSLGPNGTPSVDGGLVFALGSKGVLVCVDAAKGEEKWRKDLPKDMGAMVSNVFGNAKTVGFGWGYSWSPLVDGDNLIVIPGGPKGLVAALDKKTGKELWRSAKVPDEATYSSPIAIDVEGVRQYVVMVQDGAVGVSAKDGAELWRFKRDQPFPDVVCPTPVYHDGHVFLTAVGGPSHLLKLTKGGAGFTAADVYNKAAGRELVNELGGVVLVDKYLYGTNGKTGWKCVDFMTGKRAWSERNQEAASLVAADGMLIWMMQESGDVVLATADPKQNAEVSRFTLPKKSELRKPSGKIWTHPVIADGKLYLRDQELVFCYEIK
jgi:outer membrane protein assembly factor BamB